MSRIEQIKEFFTFTKGERKGILVLIILVFLIILTNVFSDFFISEKESDFQSFENEIENFEKSLIPINQSETDNSYFEKKYDSLQLFNFNPNRVSDKEWELLGLTEKQIKTINNWKSKGGSFKFKTDLKRIYGINEEQYNKLEPYIDLPEKKKYSEYNNMFSKKSSDFNKPDSKIPDVEKYFEFNPNEISDSEWELLGFSDKQISTIKNYINKGGKFYKKEDLKKIYGIESFQYERIKDYITLPEKDVVKENQANIKVDINNLTEEEFKGIGGFWNYNAVRIVKYRNLLGGFYKKEQLLDIYGMKREYYLKISEDIIIDIDKVEKININFADKTELAKHPYISYDDAQKIVDYRNKKGFIKTINEIQENEIVSTHLFEKIKPYLIVK